MLNVIRAPVSSTVRNVVVFRAELLSQYGAGGDVGIDLAQVEKADLSLPQLVQALRKAAADAGRAVRLRSPAPAPVAALLERAGFLAAPTADDLDFWFHGERAQ